MGDYYQPDITLLVALIEHNKTQLRIYKGIKLTWVVKTQLTYIIVNWILSKLDLRRGQLQLKFKLWGRVINFRGGLKETIISRIQGWVVRPLTLIALGLPKKEFSLMNKVKLMELNMNKWSNINLIPELRQTKLITLLGTE